MKRGEADLMAGVGQGLLRTILDSLPGFTSYLGPDERYRWVNQTYQRVFGRPRDDVVGCHVSEVLGDASYATIRDYVRQALAGEPVQFETHLDLGGGSRWVRANFIPDRDAEGQVHGIIVSVEDASDRHEAEAALRRTESLMSAVLRGARDAIFAKDRDSRYLLINAAGARILGFDVDYIIGRSDPELMPAEVAARLREADLAVLEAGKSQTFEEYLEAGDGSTLTFQSEKNVFRDHAGDIAGIVGVARDITAQRRAEQARRETEERLARIVDSAMDAIVAIDEELVVKLFNGAAEGVFQCRADEVVGTSFERFLSPQLRELVDDYDLALQRAGTDKRFLWVPEGMTARRANGDEFPVELTVSQTEPAAGHPLFTFILRDVNERRQAERERERLKAEMNYYREQAEPRAAFDDIVGGAPAIREVLHSIELVAPAGSTVLLTGETGTGKELVAQAIHSLSERRDRMMVKVNCAALPATLIESELFGHEKGAFTGALQRKAGRFEMADGGTLFLDEIGDLPLELQAKLLRALQEGEFERLGGDRTVTTDVRVIAASNQDLAAAVEAGRFRADLFYRLNVFPIRLPPLRERKGDIPELVRHFIDLIGTRHGKRIDGIDDAAMAALSRYDWPGNVRELRNVIERAVILCRSNRITGGIWLPKSNGTAVAEPLTLREVERRHILSVLERTHWKVSGKNGAAEVLDLKPTTLESRMERLGIRRPRPGASARSPGSLG